MKLNKDLLKNVQEHNPFRDMPRATERICQLRSELTVKCQRCRRKITREWHQHRDNRNSVTPKIHRAGHGAARNDTLFSQNTSMPLDTRQTRRNNNVFVFGTSRETVQDSFLFPNILQGGSSYVIHDDTGELFRTTAPALKKLGYEIRVLDLNRPDSCNKYNPFHYLSFDWDVVDLVQAVLQRRENDTDGLRDRSESALLLALCFYVRAKYSLAERNFTSVLRLLRGEEDATSSDSLLRSPP